MVLHVIRHLSVNISMYTTYISLHLRPMLNQLIYLLLTLPGYCYRNVHEHAQTCRKTMAKKAMKEKTYVCLCMRVRACVCVRVRACVILADMAIHLGLG